ncbi:efflux RND transporter periplasmic adaptor subunit [Pseudomonas sp. RIT-To-2]|uniref:efflux RND transporter periplasmic adaptor subunit n=1 Tax=Pseudomonas sp. RIT-To-2 TaxID=3462541 RepID=UPI00241329D5
MHIASFTPWMAALAIASSGLFVGCRPPEIAVPSPALPVVDVVTATPSTQTRILRLTGRITAYRSAQVRARVQGTVQKRAYIEGEDVKAGQILFRIDPAQLDVELASAEAEHSQAASAADAATDIAYRSKQLVEDHSVSMQQYRKDFFAEKQARAMEQLALAKVRSARLQLEYATVTSPISGRARKALVSEGSMVGQDEGTLLTTVEQIDPIYVEFAQPGADYLALRKARLANPDDMKAQTVSLELSDGSVYSLPGKLNFSDSALDPQTDTVALRAVFANPEHLLLPGMYVQVELERATANKAVLIPQRALGRGDKGAYVMVAQDGIAHQVYVQADCLEAKQWRVDSGLSGGERVILGGSALRDGQPVQIKESAEPAAISQR